MVKTCSKCGVAKECTDFYKYKPSKDGLSYMCRQCYSEYHKQPHVREKSNEAKRQTRKTEEWKEKQKEYRQRTKERRNENTRRRRKEKPHIGRWRGILKSTLRSLGTSKHADTKTLLGYSADELKQHMESMGMQWDIHQIDHKIPISWFHSDTPPSIVNDLRNLQPLTEEENIRKHNNYADDVDEEYFRLVQPRS